MIVCIFLPAPFHAAFKSAVVKPLLKTLHGKIFEKTFALFSNLPYLSKLIEKVIAIHLVEQTSQNAIMEKFQSAYEAHHNTETALLRVYNDVMFNIDRGNGTLLVLLDLSSHPNSFSIFYNFH